MPPRRRKPGSQGRATPKGGSTPARRGSHPDPAEPAQVGRRPSNPGFLLVVGVIWIGIGVVILLSLSWSWRLVPAIVAAGIGVLYLRGAATTVVRRDQRRGEDPKA